MTFYLIWTPADDQLLRDQLANGATAALVAKLLNRTRNSIIGRAHRLDLQLKRQKPGPSKSPKPKPKPKPKPALMPDPVTSPGHTDLMVTPETLDKFMEDNPLPSPKPRPRWHFLGGISIMKLRSTTCRWPLWDDHAPSNTERLYCGKYCEPDRVYCDPHRRMASSSGRAG